MADLLVASVSFLTEKPDAWMAVSAAAIIRRVLNPSNLKPQFEEKKREGTLRTILQHLKAGNLRKAAIILFATPHPFPFSLYSTLLKLCASDSAIIETRKVESHLVTHYPEPPIFLLNRAIEAYAKCGCLRDARELFDEMPHRDGGSWNAIITAYAQNRCEGKALDLIQDMNKAGVPMNEITFASVLGACGALLELGLTVQLHAMIVKLNYCGNVILCSSLVDVYGKCGVMTDSRQMFEEIENPNSVTWNVIIRRYLDVGDVVEVVSLFARMLRSNVPPLNHTVSSVLVACTNAQVLDKGIQIHGVIIKINLEEDKVISSSLMDMYGKCGRLKSARRVFDQLGFKDLVCWTSIVSLYAMSGMIIEARELFEHMPERNVVSWNAMLAGYTHSLQWEDAWEFVSFMRKNTEDIDHVTLVLILNICSGLSDVEIGKQVHGFVYRHGFDTDLFVANALVHMYGKCGNLRSGSSLFQQMSQDRDKVSWNALLATYARHGLSEQAMTIFEDMKWQAKPSMHTFATLLAACSNIFALKEGKQIHAYMIRNDYEMDNVIIGALVDMYCKCRCVRNAFSVFKKAATRDLISWNSMILGLCHNAMGKEVLELIPQMKEDGVAADNVTFQGILVACVYERDAKLGWIYFNSMSDEYYVIPRLEHYECMIELFTRCGYLSELERFVKQMPFDPTPPMLTRVFAVCKKHNFASLGEWAAERLNQNDPSNVVTFEVRDSKRVRR